MEDTSPGTSFSGIQNIVWLFSIFNIFVSSRLFWMGKEKNTRCWYEKRNKVDFSLWQCVDATRSIQLFKILWFFFSVFGLKICGIRFYSFSNFFFTWYQSRVMIFVYFFFMWIFRLFCFVIFYSNKKFVNSFFWYN